MIGEKRIIRSSCRKDAEKTKINSIRDGLKEWILLWQTITMAALGAVGETSVKYCTANDAIPIFVRNARGNENWPMVQNMRAALDVEQK